MYIILTTKKKKTFTSSSFASYIHQLVCPKTSSVVSQHIWTYFHYTSFNLGNILLEPFHMFVGNSFHVCREKNPNVNTENEVSMTCYTP